MIPKPPFERDLSLESEIAAVRGCSSTMIGAVSQFGRLGMMAIGDTRAEADQLFFRTLRVLDYETRFGR